MDCQVQSRDGSDVSRTPQKRQRALTPRGKATRQKIIEAAAALVYAAGAARLNLDEVMAASRTSKSQLYHYFTDKEALIQEVIAFQTKRVLTVNSDHLDAIDSFRRCGAGAMIWSTATGLWAASAAVRLAHWRTN